MLRPLATSNIEFIALLGASLIGFSSASGGFVNFRRLGHLANKELIVARFRFGFNSRQHNLLGGVELLSDERLCHTFGNNSES